MARDWLFLGMICHMLGWDVTLGIQECLKASPFCVTSFHAGTTFLCETKGLFPSTCGQFYSCPDADFRPCLCRCRNKNKYFDPILRQCVIRLGSIGHNCSAEVQSAYLHTNSTHRGNDSKLTEQYVHRSPIHKRKGRTKVNGLPKKQGPKDFSKGKEVHTSLPVTVFSTEARHVTLSQPDARHDSRLGSSQQPPHYSGEVTPTPKRATPPTHRELDVAAGKKVKAGKHSENDVLRAPKPPADTATQHGADSPTQDKLTDYRSSQGLMSESAEAHLIMDGLGNHLQQGSEDEEGWAPARVLEDPSLFPAWLIAFIVVVVVIAMMLLVLVMYD